MLDLACGIGRHSLELRRRGFEVVGVDISPDLLEMAEREAEAQSLDVSFMQADLRELDLRDEFDLVLSLNDGAVGYFETDEENRRTFEVVAQALREGGGHLMQLPNVLHAEAHLPQKSWIVGESTLELSDHHWNAEDRYIEGSTVPIRFGEVFEKYEEIPFRQRLYTVEELTEIYDVGRHAPRQHLRRQRQAPQAEALPVRDLRRGPQVVGSGQRLPSNLKRWDFLVPDGARRRGFPG